MGRGEEVPRFYSSACLDGPEHISRPLRKVSGSVGAGCAALVGPPGPVTPLTCGSVHQMSTLAAWSRPCSRTVYYRKSQVLSKVTEKLTPSKEAAKSLAGPSRFPCRYGINSKAGI